MNSSDAPNEQQIKEPLLTKEEKKQEDLPNVNVNVKEEKKDPLDELGFGIYFYRDINWCLFLTFFFFSFLSYFPWRIFQSGTAYYGMSDYF